MHIYYDRGKDDEEHNNEVMAISDSRDHDLAIGIIMVEDDHDEEEEIIFCPASPETITETSPIATTTSWLRTTMPSSPSLSSSSVPSFREDPRQRQIMMMTSTTPSVEDEGDAMMYRNKRVKCVIEDPRESNNYYDRRGISSNSNEDKDEGYGDDVIVIGQEEEEDAASLNHPPPVDEIVFCDEEDSSTNNSYSSRSRSDHYDDVLLLKKELNWCQSNTTSVSLRSNNIRTATTGITLDHALMLRHHPDRFMIGTKFEHFLQQHADEEKSKQQLPVLQNDVVVSMALVNAVLVPGIHNNVIIHRPTAMKVLPQRPVPQRAAVEQFYDAAYQNRNDITSNDIQDALIDVNLWNRKWIEQDEDPQLFTSNLLLRTSTIGTTTTKGNNDCKVNNDDDDNSFHLHDEKDAMLYAGLLAADREKGARNPSPNFGEQQSVHSQDDIDDMENHHRDHHGTDHQRTKRCRTDENNDNKQENVEHNDHLASIGMLVRPKPMRVASVVQGSGTKNGNSLLLARPIALRPSETIDQSRRHCIEPMESPVRYTIPPTIYGNHHEDDINSMGSSYHGSRRSMSPLTVSTMGHHHDGSIRTMSSRHSSMSHHHTDNVGMTQTMIEQQQINVIEDEYNDNDNYETEMKSRSNGESTITLTWIIEPSRLPTILLSARDGLLQALAIYGGDTSSEQFQSCLTVLGEHYKTECDQHSMDIKDGNHEDGLWLTLTKPNFFGNLGENDHGDPMYTLGRMSFDMFAPTNVVCSLQGNFNSVQNVTKDDQKEILETNRCHDKNYCSIPKKFKEEIEKSTTTDSTTGTTTNDDDTEAKNAMKTYDIITPFTIEPSLAAYPDALNQDVARPIRGIMTTYGYTLQDPNDKTCRSVWITGGKIEPNNDVDDDKQWKEFFTKNPPKYGFGQKAKLLAVKLLMGATVPESMDQETGMMEYTFTRPIGGHGMAYVDTLYCDSTLRIVKGHRGTVFVFTRMSDKK